MSATNKECLLSELEKMKNNLQEVINILENVPEIDTDTYIELLAVSLGANRHLREFKEINK